MATNHYTPQDRNAFAAVINSSGQIILEHNVSCEIAQMKLTSKDNKQLFKFVNSKLGNDTRNGQSIYTINNHGNQLYGDIKIAETFDKEFLTNFNSIKIFSSCLRATQMVCFLTALLLT